MLEFKMKKFCILNEQVSEEKYKNDIQKFLSLTPDEQIKVRQNIQKSYKFLFSKYSLLLKWKRIMRLYIQQL